MILFKLTTALWTCSLLFALAAQEPARRKGKARRAAATRRAVRAKVSKMREGNWGGRGIALTVGNAGARLEFDCARGTIDGPISLRADGSFEARGTFTKEAGGPASVFEELDEGAQAKPDGDARPARYSGRVSGGRATLTVAFADTNETAGSYALAFDAEPQLVKCL